jgi:hypothetical protein
MVPLVDTITNCLEDLGRPQQARYRHKFKTCDRANHLVFELLVAATICTVGKLTAATCIIISAVVEH